MRSPVTGFWLSALIHILVLGGGALLLQSPAQFGVDAGRSSVDINLVAAAPDPESVSSPATDSVVSEEPQPPQPEDPADMAVPIVPPTPVPITPTPIDRPVAKAPAPPSPKPVRTSSARTVEKGDGSSPKPGKDATTASSEGGAIVDGKPQYLRNPPPVYPESARREKQEGLVVLQVIVNVEGRPDAVSIRNGSGFPSLDESAVKAVSHWRFQPATLGGIKVKSRVLVPVRFRLDS